MAVKVDGVEITEQEIQAEVEALRPEYVEYVRQQGGEPSDEQVREWAVENLIEGLLLRHEAIKTQPVPNEERVRKELESADYSAFPEEQRSEQARVNLQQRRLVREIRKAVKPPADEEARAFYAANPGMFVAAEGLRLSHICRWVDPATRAEAFLDLLRIKSEIEQGRISWIEAVQAYSDTVERDSGMFATVTRGDLPKAAEEALFALAPGALSDVIELDTQTLHLFKLLVKLEPQQMPYEAVEANLKSSLFEQACQDALNARLDLLKAAAAIEGWSPSEPTAAQ